MKGIDPEDIGVRTAETALELTLADHAWTLTHDSMVNAYHPGPRIYERNDERLWIRLYRTALYVTYNGDWELPTSPEEIEAFHRGSWNRFFVPR